MTTKQITERMTWWDKNYALLVAYNLNTDERIELGDSKVRKCRFCGGEKPTSKFKQTKHAIPELIGNHTLISMYECDACNAHFSKKESQFSNFMGFYHTLTQIHGKQGVPSFKPNSKDFSRIDIAEKGLNIKQKEDEYQFLEINEEEKTGKLKGKRSYVPEDVHKCLVKMALSIMPESEMLLFTKTAKWLMEDNKKGSCVTQHASLPTFLSVYPSKFPFISVMLFRKKDNSIDDVPYCLFVLAYGNFTFQIHLPLCEKDERYEGRQDISIGLIPNLLDIHGINPTIHKLDLASKEKVKNEEVWWSLQFEGMKETILNPETGEPIPTSPPSPV